MPQYQLSNFDAHVKSPFYVDLGIQEFRNCELLSVVSAKGITQNLEFADFLRDHQVYNANCANWGVCGLGLRLLRSSWHDICIFQIKVVVSN